MAQDRIDLTLHQVKGQTIVRDHPAHHATALSGGIEDGHRVAQGRQVPGAGQAGGPASHHRHLLGAGRRRLRRRPRLFVVAGVVRGIVLVSDMALQRADRDRLFHELAPIALRLAGVMADPAADPDKGHGLVDDLKGLVHLARGQQLHISVGVNPRRAGDAAGGDAFFVHREGAGDRLGEHAIDGVLIGQELLEEAHGLDRAVLGAVAAALAQVDIYPAVLLLHGHGVIARLTTDLLHIRPGDHLDVQMPAHAHQPRADGAHGAVIGGEGLVQTDHPPADRGFALQEVHLDPGLRQVQGGLHAADAGAHYQGCAHLAVAAVIPRHSRIHPLGRIASL